jgi:hypothetical protein
MPIELPEGVERIYGTERPRYYVMRIGGGPARKPYGSRFRAEEDAVTLANENPGAEFAVVKVKAIFKSNAAVPLGDSEQDPLGIDDEQVPDGIAAEQVVPA